MSSRRRAAAEGALLGTVVADALGAPFEGAPSCERSEGVARLQRALGQAPLRYTDDSQMTLALAAHLVEMPQVDPDELARAFLAAFEPWRGYGGGTLAVFESWRRGTPVEEAATAVFEEGSLGNGGAMRIAPLGVRWADDPARLAEAAERATRTTHVHPVGVAGALAQARAVALATARARFGPEELAEVARAAQEPTVAAALGQALDLPAGPDVDAGEVARRLGNEVVAHRSVPTALWIAAGTTGYQEAIALALAVGGDTDTIAAMAGAVRGAADGPNSVPGEWQRAAEGVDEAHAAAERLLASARR